MANKERRQLLITLGGLACLGAQAQEAQVAVQPPPQLQAQLIKTGLYLITGGGGNSLLRFSANGLILVNGKSPDSYKPLMSQVRKINKLADMPLRALILTNARDEQAANSARFAAAKVPILLQANAVPRLKDSGSTALVPFDQSYLLKLGGVQIELKYFGRATTDADAVVWFPDKQVVAVGDLYSPQGPQLDAAAGGNLAGWSTALAQVLALDFDQAVPNEGPAVGRAELTAFKRQLDALI